MLANNLRWTLERNRMELPDHPLVARLRKTPLITAEKNTVEELHALHQQTHILAELLTEWNSSVSEQPDSEWLTL